MLSRPPRELVADSLIGGRYRVLGELGRGGVATVYRVRDERDGRLLALKRLRIDHCDEKRTHHLNMLEREYRTLAQLAHPRVIQVYDYAAEDLEPYYTMELLEGDDLRHHAHLPWQHACQLMRDVCSSLALLHSRRLLHRDVSPRNVHRTADGRAKLIDFGAMVGMGKSRTIVGTPPLVPPEALHGQDSDGRCDLYAVGGTLYWLLTGRHAYPARSMAHLPDVWQLPPIAPSKLAPEVPQTLDALIMSMLNLDPAMRPRTAGEVMERLSAIAGLPDDEHLSVTQSYLTTPTLVGRSQPLARVRHALIGALGSSGGVILIEGPAGIGRSRFLDACALEARLLRARVIQLEPRAGARALLGEGPDGAREERRAGPADADDALPELVAALRARAEEQPLVVTVDDVEHAGVELLGALTAIAEGTRDARVLLLLSTREERDGDVALAPIREGAERLPLGALTRDDGEELLRSVFGDSPGLRAVADRIHGLAQGNPAAVMALAQHLVDSGRARYELGGWALPASLGEHDLPTSLTAALIERLDQLDDDARELADALSLALPYGVTADDHRLLLDDPRGRRSERALASLLESQVLSAGASGYAFTSQLHAELLRESMAEPRRRALFARLAARLPERGRDRLDLARCALSAGDEAAAVDHLCLELGSGSRWADAPPGYGALLEHCAGACTRLGRPYRQRFMLLRELVFLGNDLSVAGLPAMLRELFDHLQRWSGLTDYAATPQELEPGERLELALAAAQARHDAADERARGLPPLEAVRTLAQLVRHAAAFATSSIDHGLVTSLPDLTPFAPLSPAIAQLVRHTIPACVAMTEARIDCALTHMEEVLRRLQEPDRAGLDPEMHGWAINAARFAVGQMHAGIGLESALGLADALERETPWLLAAWDLRRAYHLRQGNLREVERARQRMERLQLERAHPPPMLGASARLELEAYATADDLIGVKRARDRLEELGARHAGFAPCRHHALAEYERLRGNHGAGLAAIERALSMVHPGLHASWPSMAVCHLQLLGALGRHREAVRIGRGYVETARDARLGMLGRYVETALARPEAMIGEFDAALGRIEQALGEYESLGARGLNPGRVLETRAWIAIRMGDRESFLRYARLCAQEYRKGEANTALGRRYEALMHEARQAGISIRPELLRAGVAEGPGEASTPGESVARALGGCSTRDERAARALSMLVESTGARGGSLYLVDPAGIRLAARSFDGELPAELEGIAADLIAIELDEGSTAMLSTQAVLGRRPRLRRDVRPVLLTCRDGGRLAVVGAATLMVEPGRYDTMPFSLSEAIAAHLLEVGDVLRNAG